MQITTESIAGQNKSSQRANKTSKKHKTYTGKIEN